MALTQLRSRQNLKIGDKVRCRFFNVQENKFYGDCFDGEIIDIKQSFTKPYFVKRESLPVIQLFRKEIKWLINT